MKVRLEKEFDELVWFLKQTPDGIVISSMIDGGPASKSGLVLLMTALSKLMAKTIDGESLPNVMDLMRGSKGSKIELVLARSIQDGNKQVEKQVIVNLERAPIAVKDERVDVNLSNLAMALLA